MTTTTRTLKIKSDKDLGRALQNVAKSRDAAWNGLQDAVLYGLDQFESHSANCGPLTRIMIFMNSHSMPAKVMQAFIQDHANVVYTNLSDGTKGFKKANKGPAVVTWPEEGDAGCWWNHETAQSQQARPDMMDVAAEFQKLVKRIKEKAAKGLIPQEQRELLELAESGKLFTADILHMEPLPKEKLFSQKGGASDGTPLSEGEQQEPAAQGKAEKKAA